MYDTQAPFIAAFVILRRENTVAFVLRSHTSWMNGFYGLPSGKEKFHDRARGCDSARDLEPGWKKASYQLG